MKALIVTRVSGFLPQFEMNNVHILQEMGYEVHYASNFNTVVYGKDNSRLDGTDIIRHQIDFERLPLPWKVHKAYKQIKELLLNEEFDIIHCHMPMSAVVARKAAEDVRRKTKRNIPVLYTAHGFHFYTGAPLANWIYYPIEKHLARYTDRLILINEEDYKRASAKFKVRGKIETTRGIGMNLDKYAEWKKDNWRVDKVSLKQKKQNNHSKTDIYKKYSIPEGNAILISVGELTKRKNNSVMIDAMKELLDLPITYLICGSGPMEAELKKEVKEAGLEKRVKFAGFVDHVEELLVQADCFVFPSLQEGLPVAVMEAMAVGLPVIATKIRGITDLIVHTKGGYLVEDWEPENYAVKVRRMFTDKNGKSNVSRDIRRKQMGEWNREQIKKFSMPVVDKKMREIYADVIRESEACGDNNE